MQQEGDKVDALKTVEEGVDVITQREEVDGKKALPEFYKRKEYVDPGGADW